MSVDKDTRVYGRLVPHVKNTAKTEGVRTFTAAVNLIIEKDRMAHRESLKRGEKMPKRHK